MALIWSRPLFYLSADNPYGTTNEQIQSTLIQNYHSANIKLMISAFGATEHPTTLGADPVTTCTTMAQFVKNNHLDGIDLDWEDNDAMEEGTGEQWLIDCTLAIRAVLPVG